MSYPPSTLPNMPDRWTLTRAGITNVYQYDDEILHFGGGRLLLRGVNGSGKSTAMNMLLPFLLDADTRRIDAAGEQSGVLRSWMLSGREETQPVGYLWLEFAQGAEHLACGCGIRANRNTDRVSTWWFVTDQRPGIDFSLVESRIPVSADVLKTKIGDQAVFRHDQRSAYRSTIRSRLFGGADLDQHIRLLHVVRNPRVGDRIDIDLPRHLEDALPPLSEAAVDDAARPLEDLDDHRRNVETLTTTHRALEGLLSTYRQYSRTELHDRARKATETANRAIGHARELTKAKSRLTDARAVLNRTKKALDTIGARVEGVATEIKTLEESIAYRAGQELDSERRHLEELAGFLSDSKTTVNNVSQRVERLRDAVTTAHAAVTSEHETVRAQLNDLEESSRTAGLAVGPPNVPAVATSFRDDVPVPDDPEVELPVTMLEDVRGAAHRRRDDIAQVESALDQVGEADAELHLADQTLTTAEEDLKTAQERLVSARSLLDAGAEQFKDELSDWHQRLTDLASRHGVQPPQWEEPVPASIVDDRHEIHARALDAVDLLADNYRQASASLVAQLDNELAEAQRLTDILDSLNRQSLLDPPVFDWQNPDPGPRLSELIDFAPGLDAQARADVEAALEGAGLLGATITGDGEVTLESGELVVVPAGPVSAPLSGLLVPHVPENVNAVTYEEIRSVLGGISTDHASGHDTVVARDGSFRIGTLQGRHQKDVAEHIGTAARRAAIERRKAEAAAFVDEAQEKVRLTEESLTERKMWLDETMQARKDVPDPAALSEAVTRAQAAERAVDDATARLSTARERQKATERSLADAVSETQRLAAELALPAHRSGLEETKQVLGDTTQLASECIMGMKSLGGAHQRWHSATKEWDAATIELETEKYRDTGLKHRHDRAETRLATLEDSIGLEYQEVLDSLAVCRSDLDRLENSQEEARDEYNSAIREEAQLDTKTENLRDQLQDLENDAVDTLTCLRRTWEVPGLLESAIDPEGTVQLPAVESNAGGLAELASALTGTIPRPDGDGVNADGVRQSLRRRRDTLGAGWDAEDRQPDPGLPAAVEINGPLGRMSLVSAVAEVASHREQQASLLTTKQDQALRNLLQGLIAREVAEKLTDSDELVRLMNKRLDAVATSHGVGAKLKWRRRDDIDPHLSTTIDLLSKPPDLRTPEEDDRLTEALSARIDDARRTDPELAYHDLVREVLDYRRWHEMSVYVTRTREPERKLGRRTPLSEGEKKIVSYLTLFSAVAASYDAVAAAAEDTPRFVLLDDAFAKVSEDNHAKLFGLLVEMDLDFIATSERLWGTHATVPELAITEVIRDAELSTIVLEHSRWNGTQLEVT